MVTLLIAVGALLIAVVGAAFLDPDEECKRLMEEIPQSFF
jgi:hypothetical protein